MEAFLFWPVLGAFIGVIAAQRRGFGVVGGVLGGLLLGPLAFLMFFCNTVSGSPARKCPYCAEYINSDAVVCKHCHRDLPAMRLMTVNGKRVPVPVRK